MKITFMLAISWHQVHSLSEHGTLKSRIYSSLIEVFFGILLNDRPGRMP